MKAIITSSIVKKSLKNMLKTSKRNISKVVKDKLCTGCGICYDACPHKAITINISKQLYTPSVAEELCTDCGLCLKICPGKGIELAKFTKSLFDESEMKVDPFIGSYINCYAGYSNNHDIRFHSASGGALSHFLIYLLDKKIINGAVVTGYLKDNPTQTSPYIATNAQEVFNAKSSKYCPVSLGGIVSQIKKSEGKYIIVGLPCHIHGLRKLEQTDRNLKRKILGYFALYCSGTRLYLSQDYLFMKYNIQRKKIKTFTYRDDGCLGFLKVTFNNNGSTVKVPYKDYYLSMRGFFTPPRCSLCIDHYGELSDVSFGDLHVDKYAKDNVGISSVVTRNKLFENYLKLAVKEQYLTLKPITPATLNKSQTFVTRSKKGNGAKTAFTLSKLLGKKLPDYDVSVNARVTFQSTIRYFANVTFRQIGRIPQLWFLINILDKIGLVLTNGRRR
jgi:coenzyme F420 hydrogenase subunit beta